MLFKGIALTATLATTVLGAAMRMPVFDSVSQVHANRKRDYLVVDEIWQSYQTATPEYSHKTDDQWLKVHLKFPMKIYGKSSSVVYFNMNGLISLDKPSKALSVPAKDLPVDSVSCSNNRASYSCIPDNTVALLWQDLFIPTNGTFSVAWVYHDAVLQSNIRRHYHINWKVCDKTATAVTATGECSPSAYRSFSLNYFENTPGVFHLQYHNIPKNTTLPGIVGAQSYPQHMQAQEAPNMVLEREGFSMSCLIMDTNTGTFKYPTQSNQCDTVN
ncbi:hypothetical protein DRE_04818 [Drechslerella stenobrocha 248]|uniref:Uncharacterized protein n=1 Tax=Drechslerella stenobrocha 248 TaxID=1043628 RepID=W7IAF4_9PEZI|nr:hypothetical protein DRE_04818 [Drechslerella stenobrocha 248]